MLTQQQVQDQVLLALQSELPEEERTKLGRRVLDAYDRRKATRGGMTT